MSKNPSYILPDNGLIPPHDNNTEQAVLGALILERNAIERVSDIISKDVFYRSEHALIFEALSSLYLDNKPIDIITVTERLNSASKLEICGGAYYLAQLTMKVGSAAHVETHARILFELYIHRELITLGYEINSLGYDKATDIQDSILTAEGKINDLIGLIAGRSKITHISEPVNEAIEQTHHRVQNVRKGVQAGINTGLVDLNRATYGWQNSNLIILAARPAMGKTSLMLHFAKAAAKTGVATVIFSLEMSDVKLSDRLILSETNIDPDRYRSGYLDNDELKEIEIADGILSGLPIYVDDKSDVTMGKIRARAKHLQKQGKCGIVFIDYLGLCKEAGIGRSREQEVSNMSREAKIIAKEMNIPVILLAQLNRDVEKRGGNREPQLSDLRDSGGIEQDADQVIFIHRPAYYGIEVVNKNGYAETNYGELLIRKNRDGACGKVCFKHNDGMTKIFDYNFNNEPF